MWTFFSLFLFIILLFSPPTAGTDGFDLLSAGGGGGGGGDDGAEHQQASNNPFILADASSELQKLPTDERNKQECRRSEFGGIGNSNVIINNNNNNNNNNNRKQARRDQQKNSGVCANDNTVVIPLTEEPKKPQTTTPQIQPSEGSGGRRGGRRKPDRKPKDYSTKDFPADNENDDEDIGPAFNFSPVANPNICKDPLRPIPVCHNLVRSFSGDLDDVLFELARCYPC